MSYNLDALLMFEPLSSLDEREGTAYFELYPKELPSPDACWLPGSFLLKDAAFDFFTECFHSANTAFDYFSFLRFDEPEISQLIKELDGFLLVLASEPTREQLFSKYASIFNPNIWSNIDTQILAKAVYLCGEKMRSFVQSNTRESKCLWVLGM